MIFAGVDVGSLSAEALLMQDSEILASYTIKVKPNPVTSATIVMEEALRQAGLCMDDITFTVSTGYGREQIPFAQHNVSEISCHGKGAFWANNEVRTIIDIGGQDCKAIRVDESGDLVDFIMNDKCAAGTGRFLESIAKTFGVEVWDLGDMALKGGDAVPISTICTVFTNFDVMCFMAQGRSREDVALGVADALAIRTNRLVATVGVEDKVAITGGVAKNAGVVRSLERILETTTAKLKCDPQIIGAVGAALYAEQRYNKIQRKKAKEAKILK